MAKTEREKQLDENVKRNKEQLPEPTINPRRLEAGGTVGPAVYTAPTEDVQTVNDGPPEVEPGSEAPDKGEGK